MAKNRPLRNVYQRLGNFEAELQDIIAERGRASVLEIGCGFGLPMIQLIRRFRGRVKPTGINRFDAFNRPRRALVDGVRRRAVPPWAPFTHGLCYPYPRYVNTDAAETLPFEDNAFDYAYSIATVFFISDRLNLLRELNRVLRPGARARLHYSHSLIEFETYAAGSWSDETLDLIRIEDCAGRRIPFPDFVASVPGLSLQFNRRHEWLELVASDGPLDLGLKFRGSFPMTSIDDAFPHDFPRSEYTMVAA